VLAAKEGSKEVEYTSSEICRALPWLGTGRSGISGVLTFCRSNLKEVAEGRN